MEQAPTSNPQHATSSGEPLSAAAARLLSFLSRYANARNLAKRDRELARILSVPVRNVIDLAGELLDAGHVVIGEVGAPHGRWLLDPKMATPEEWQRARDYVEDLQGRGVAIMSRAKRVREALAQMEAARKTETTGQGRLFVG